MHGWLVGWFVECMYGCCVCACVLPCVCAERAHVALAASRYLGPLERRYGVEGKVLVGEPHMVFVAKVWMWHMPGVRVWPLCGPGPARRRLDPGGGRHVCHVLM